MSELTPSASPTPDAATRSGAAPMRHLSFSQAKTWQQCPLRWRLERIERVPRAPSAALILGTAFHHALEMDAAARIAARPFAGSVALFAAFLEALDAGLVEGDPYGCLVGEQRTQMVERGLAMLRTYWRELRPQIEPVAVEERFEVPLEGMPGWTFVGRRDLRTVRGEPNGEPNGERGGRRVRVTWDFKSATRAWDERKRAEASEQALAYAYAELAERRTISGHFVFAVFACAVPDGWTVGERLACTLEQHGAAVSMGAVLGYGATLRRVAREIEAAQAGDGAYPARPGPLCGWCNVARDCPEGREWVVQHGRTFQPEIARFMATMDAREG